MSARLFVPSSSRISILSLSRRDLIQGETIPALSLGFLFVLSHSLRSGEHELPYSDATCEGSTLTNDVGRITVRGGILITVVSLRSLFQIVPINYDRYSIDDGAAPDPWFSYTCFTSRYHAVCRQERRGRRFEEETSEWSSSNNHRITHCVHIFSQIDRQLAGK